MAALIAKYELGNLSGSYLNLEISGDGAWPKIGQTFAGNGKKIGSCMWYIKKRGTGSGNLYAQIYNIGSGLPTGATLATSDLVTSSNVGTDPGLYTFNFSGANQIALTDGTIYGATIECDAGDPITNTILLGRNVFPGTSGHIITYNITSSAWGAYGDTINVTFYIYDNQFSPLMNYHQM